METPGVTDRMSTEAAIAEDLGGSERFDNPNNSSEHDNSGAACQHEQQQSPILAGRQNLTAFNQLMDRKEPISEEVLQKSPEVRERTRQILIATTPIERVASDLNDDQTYQKDIQNTEYTPKSSIQEKTSQSVRDSRMKRSKVERGSTERKNQKSQKGSSANSATADSHNNPNLVDPECESIPGAHSIRSAVSQDSEPSSIKSGLFVKRSSREGRRPVVSDATVESGGNDDTSTAVSAVDLERGQNVESRRRPGVIRIAGRNATDAPSVLTLESSMNETILDRDTPQNYTGGEVAAMAVSRDDLEAEVQNRILAQAAVGEVVDLPSKEKFISVDRERKRTKMALIAVVLVAVLVIVVILTRGGGGSDNGGAKLFMDLLQNASLTTFNISDPSGLALLNTESPQYQAYTWMVEENPLLKELVVDDSTTTLLLEQYALATLYYSTSGNTTWKKEGHAFLTNPDTCSWLKDFSHCADNLVATLDLAELNLTGTIPKELVFLEQLDMLNLSANNIEGVLPSNLLLDSLTTVDLHANSLRGPLPFAPMPSETSLEYLDISTNDFSDAIPDELYHVTSLESVILNNNPITGTTSTLIGSLINLQVLEAGNTSLSGTIPSEFGLCLELNTLYLSSSVNITGSIPDEIWLLPELQRLDTSYLGVRMALPGELMSNMAMLEELNLSAGRLFGTIPTEIGLLTALRILDMSSNPVLSGTIPTEIGQLGALQFFDLSRNAAITGTLPSEMGNLSNLETLWIFYSAMTGQIPTEIGRATNLIDFNAEETPLYTNFPTELGMLTKLQIFSTMFNAGMYGPIPTEIGLLTDLQALRTTGDLTGTIPVELALATDLRMLILSDGMLTGTIPRQLGQLFELSLLVLTRQQLTGTLPLTLAALTNLGGFDVSYNQLTGNIPPSYKDWTQLQMARFNFNNFTGSANMNLCSGFNSNDYNFFADCSEFSDTCQCCTHCCGIDEDTGATYCREVGVGSGNSAEGGGMGPPSDGGMGPPPDGEMGPPPDGGGGGGSRGDDVPQLPPV